MENIKAIIGCMGTCIIRDIVGMHDGNAGYMVERLTQTINGEMQSSIILRNIINTHWQL